VCNVQGVSVTDSGQRRLPCRILHNILQAQASRPFSTVHNPSQQCTTAFKVHNSIQDPPPRWILTIFKLKFGGGNLFSLVMTSTIKGNNSVGSLLKPLLKKVTPVVDSRMLCMRNVKSRNQSAVQLFFWTFRILE
jgi:hypothetical protein